MKKRKKWMLLTVLVLLIAAILWIAYENTALERRDISVASGELPDAFDGFRVAHVSDLHNTEMGEGNEALLALLRSSQPDIIAITGDLIDSRNTDVAVALAFAQEAMKIAPCYYVTGNHESRKSEFLKLEEGLLALGVKVLRNEEAVLEQNGEKLRILGVDDPTLMDNTTVGAELERLGSDGFTLLLSHRPELFDTYCEAGMNVVLSGHAHGGQFRIPFIGGVIAPHQGFFPEYDSGLYAQEETHMIVSRGIGNSIFPFRVNNPPEVIIVTLEAV